MSLIAELRAAQQAFEAAQQRLAQIENDPDLRNLQAFEAELRELMAQYKMSLKDINMLIDPDYREPKVKPVTVSKARTARTFTNPHTGEKVVSTGGINKTLAEWRKEYGVDVVKSWGVLEN